MSSIVCGGRWQSCQTVWLELSQLTLPSGCLTASIHQLFSCKEPPHTLVTSPISPVVLTSYRSVRQLCCSGPSSADGRGLELRSADRLGRSAGLGGLCCLSGGWLHIGLGRGWAESWISHNLGDNLGCSHGCWKSHHRREQSLALGAQAGREPAYIAPVLHSTNLKP